MFKNLDWPQAVPILTCALLWGILGFVLPAQSSRPSQPSKAQDASTRPGNAGSMGTWPMHRGDLANTGRAHGSADAVKGEVVWEYLAGNKIKQSPVIADGMMFIGDYDSIFYAIRLKDGKRIWNSTPRATKLHKTTLPKVGDDLLTKKSELPQTYRHSNPVIVGPDVITCTRIGIMTSFRRSDGRQNWEREFKGLIFSSPKVFENRILVGSLDNFFYSLDPKTGETQWKFECGSMVGATCAVTKGGTVIFPSYDRNLYFLDARSGEKKRQIQTKFRSTATPLVAMGCVVYVTELSRWICVDMLTSEIRWEHRGAIQHQQGVGIAGRRVFAHLMSRFDCRDILTGKLNWSLKLDGAGAVSPVVGKDLVYICDESGHATAIDIISGKVVWKVMVDERGALASPALVDGVLYAAGSSGKIVAIR